MSTFIIKKNFVDVMSSKCDEKTSKRYKKLFGELDRDSDGKIDVNDLLVLFDKNAYTHRESSLARARVILT